MVELTSVRFYKNNYIISYYYFLPELHIQRLYIKDFYHDVKILKTA